MSRRNRDRRRRPRKKESQLLYIILTGVFLFSIFGMVGGSVYLRQSQETVDEVTLCPARAPERAFVVLVDVSSPINAVQQQSILNQVEKLKLRLRAGDKLMLYALEPTSDLLKPRLTVCRPKSGQEVSSLTGDQKSAGQLFKDRFETPFETMARDLLEAKPAKSSPIMRGVQAAVVSGFGALPDTTDKHLIVVSDMLEFDGGRSHYDSSNPPDAADLDGPGYASLFADMRGVDVEVWYVQRPGDETHQGIAHVEFWEAFFAKSGGALVRVYKVEG